DQNMDAWGCYDCGISGEPTLTKAKEKIDKMHLKLRKESAFPCYEIAMSETRECVRVKADEATVIDYLGRKESRSWSSREVKFEGHKVASMARRGGSARRARRETLLHLLAAQTPEVHAAIEEADRLGEIAHAAKVKFQEAFRAIPRVEFDEIAGLVEASGHRFLE
ncbi:MAG: hypothetical protein ABJI29_03165, partial [Alphaproteobacteria bacterium]